MDYAIVVKKIRELIGTDSVNQFCKKTGLHQSNTNAFLNGKKYSISLEDLVAVSKIYDIPLDFFVKEDFKYVKPPVQKDEELEKLINDFKDRWQSADIRDRHFLSVRMEQVFNEYHGLIVKREPDETDEAKTA